MHPDSSDWSAIGEADGLESIDIRLAWRSWVTVGRRSF